MRKLYFIVIPVFLSFFFLSCDTEGGKDDIQYTKTDYTLELGRFAGLDEDAEWQIIQAYLKKLQSDGGHGNLAINDVRVEQFYGFYSSWDSRPSGFYPKKHMVAAVRMSPTVMDYGTEQRDVVIDVGYRHVVARYYDNSAILIWEEGNLYNYDIEKDRNYLGPLLAEPDFLKIINQHNGLDFETDAMIREAIGKSILTGWPVEDYVYIKMKYLGAYNGYTALTLYSGAAATMVYEQRIGGVLFFHPYIEQRVLAWKEGEIYKLEDLYEQGLITREDLIEMAYFHDAAK